MLVSANVPRLRCSFRLALTVNRFELRNRDRSTITLISQKVEWGLRLHFHLIW